MSFGAATAPKDVEITAPPSDGVSDVHFHPQADYLAVASWDNSIRVYEIAHQNGMIQSQGKAELKMDAPVLSCRWSADGAWMATAGCDKTVRIFDVATQQQLGSLTGHDAPIRAVRWVEQQSGSKILASGSWDKTVRYWDPRAGTQPVAMLQLKERVLAMDSHGPVMVLGLAERHIEVVNLNNPGAVLKSTESPLKWQTRAISCFPLGPAGYAVGSIEGRCSIQYIDEANSASNFSFKCHREGNNVFPVHSIAFHPVFGTFSTAGGDGTICFWDKDAKQRLKTFDNVGAPINATAFNRTGSIFAYGIGYDWAKGVQGANNPRNTVMLHVVKEEDIKNKPKKQSGR